MRVTTWNRPTADVDESLGMLGRMSPDLVALQECRQPDGDDTSVVWRGHYQQQGSAVVSTSAAFPIEAVDVPCLHPTVVPAVVRVSEPFVFVGVWTHPKYDEVAWDAVRACAVEAHRLGMPVVAAGDFNVSPGVSGQEHTTPRFLERVQDELGLVSAYHHCTGDAFGEEASATYYHQWKESNPFHIDYCFLPEAWAGSLTSVEVGDFETWTESDHRPLTVEFVPTT